MRKGKTIGVWSIIMLCCMMLGCSKESYSNENEAYRRMMTRENYIVDLISMHSGEETSFEAWEYNLEYLKVHYDEIIALEDVNKLYVDIYIEDYEGVKRMEDMPPSKGNEE